METGQNCHTNRNRFRHLYCTFLTHTHTHTHTYTHHHHHHHTGRTDTRISTIQSLQTQTLFLCFFDEPTAQRPLFPSSLVPACKRKTPCHFHLCSSRKADTPNLIPHRIRTPGPPGPPAGRVRSVQEPQAGRHPPAAVSGTAAVKRGADRSRRKRTGK